MTQSITTVAEFDNVLTNGPYAWPGGYPIYFLVSDGEALSFDAAKAEADLIREAIRDGTNAGGWRVVGAEINWEDTNLHCAHSGERIGPAYDF